MSTRTVIVKLNQQQLDLLDRTLADTGEPDRQALILRALREQAARQSGTAEK